MRATAKLYGNEILVRSAEEAIQIVVVYVYIRAYLAERYYRDAKIATIGEGTPDIQRMFIAWQLLEF